MRVLRVEVGVDVDIDRGGGAPDVSGDSFVIGSSSSDPVSGDVHGR